VKYKRGLYNMRSLNAMNVLDNKSKRLFDPTRQWKHFDNTRWNKKDRENVTVLLNMIDRRKSLIFTGFLDRIGISYIDLGNCLIEDFMVGRQYGTPGLCNAVYFIVGSVIRKLEEIRNATGVTKEELCERYVFVTPSGPCSPCRYGMYSQEYLKAINDAGYHGFRVLSFSSDLGGDVVDPDDAFRFDLPFRINLLLCLILADAVHARDMEIRPYEKRPGATAEVVAKVEDSLREALRSPLYIREIPRALERARILFDGIECASTRRPKIFITGEIFANNCNSDGNYNIREFCIENGCEVNPSLFSIRVFFDFNRRLEETIRDLKYNENGISQKRDLIIILIRQKVGIAISKYLVNGVFKAIGAKTHYPNIRRLFEMADPYYNQKVFGGEGNLEVAEAIEQSKICDGFISIKPFGCLPSSGVSDGVQAKIQEIHPELNFLSIETSGDNRANVMNRVSMLLFKAKQDHRARLVSGGCRISRESTSGQEQRQLN
jgi:predicted nucleotide-binding protein (sugar kinase/HSP70/actin superfamily)